MRSTTPLLLAAVLVTAAAGLSGQASPAFFPVDDDPAWGCYAPAHGHPTNVERTSFVGEIAPAALVAESRGGPPAAGVVAMAALESGYGFTRTAIFAINLFGWKFTSAAAASGRRSWTLRCQPASDPGNRYIAFPSRADSVGFVAGKLGGLPRYAAYAKQYHADRQAGVNPATATERWVKGIAMAGYNPYPDYPSKVMTIVRGLPTFGTSADAAALKRATPNPGPPEVISDAAALTDAAASPPHLASTAALEAATSYLDARLEKSRYLTRGCDAQAITDWPNYGGRLIRRCTYGYTGNGKTLSAIVYLMNPDEANVAARIANACKAVGLSCKASCGYGLAQLIVGQNGGQFPVAGFVIERKGDAGGAGPDPVYLEFRDGVTVRTADGLNFSDAQLSDAAMEHAARAAVIRAMVYARIANATRQQYRAGGGTSDAAGTAWPAIVRANEFAAQSSGRDTLLVGVARSMAKRLVSWCSGGHPNEPCVRREEPSTRRRPHGVGGLPAIG